MGEFLVSLLKEREGLHIHLLIWDFNPIYLAERELLMSLRFRLQGHERLHLHLDAHHPVGASHHQKVVVVDDRVALSGGIDLSRWRWDTPEHKPDDPRRIDPAGNPYPPFHDLMMAVDGDAAKSLGQLARERWQASGSTVAVTEPTATDHDPWPASVAAVLTGHSVAIARTLPGFGSQPAVGEVASLYADSIAAARHYIYIENQYFTSHAITGALLDRLREDSGPEMILVLPHHTGGWLEQATMDVLREKLLARLINADRQGRLRVYFADQAGLGDECISVHAKLTLIDDRFLRIGSANTSGRSLGCDTECDLAVEASDRDSACAIRDFLHQLLGEHLAVAPDAVAEARDATGSLIKAVESLRGNDRTLSRLPVEPSELAGLLPEGELIDPQEPINSDYFMRYVVPRSHRRATRLNIVLFITLLVALVALAVAWRWTPLGEWLSAERLAASLELLQNPAWQAVVATAAIALSTLLMVPLTLAVIAAGLLLNPWTAFFCSLVGTLLSGLVAFLAGRLLSGSVLQQFAGGRLHQLSKALSKKGVVTVAMLRLVPIAPYTVVNLVAGASHLRLAQFMLGSALGLTPGILGLTLLSDSLFEAVIHPGPASLAWLVGVVLVLVAGALLIRRALGSRRQGSH